MAYLPADKFPREFQEDIDADIERLVKHYDEQRHELAAVRPFTPIGQVIEQLVDRELGRAIRSWRAAKTGEYPRPDPDGPRKPMGHYTTTAEYKAMRERAVEISARVRRDMALVSAIGKLR